MENDMRGLLSPDRRETYIRAGNATVTLLNPVTGNRYTYKIRKSDGERPVYFVALLSGPDNEHDFRYIGTIFSNGFRATKGSKVTTDAPSFRAFDWFLSHIRDSRITVYHEGVCGKCGRKLTVPESIESGIGPVCAESGF